MPGKKITIQDIADTANVSKSTVSRVLNDSTPVNEQKRAAVLEAMAQLKFKPNIFARSLAGGQSMTIGIVTQNIGSPFYDMVTQGVIRTLAKTDYSPIFADGQWQRELELAAISTLVERQVDGLIMIGGDLDADSLDAVSEGLPTILVARKVAGWEDRSVLIDNVAAAHQATSYLIGLGHRDIAHITGIKSHQDAIDRRTGFERAMNEANLEVSPELIVEGNFSSQSGVVALESLLVRGRPFTALFAGNDEMAIGARLALYRRGIRVPEDISIIGFDNQPTSAFMTPPLTTVDQPAFKMGQVAADALMRAIKNDPLELSQLDAELIIRESTASRR